MNAIQSHRTVANLLRLHMFQVRKIGSLEASQTLMYKNPCLELQQYLEVPIFKAEENCFNPNLKSMQIAQDLFIPGKNYTIERIAKAVHPEKYPDHDLPEVAFIGRSNAGKSSLLKAILHECPNLKLIVSKKPGMTKSLNFYQVSNKLCLVDMPGYGYRAPKFFKESAIHYMQNRRNLTKTFLLIDGIEGFHSWDDAAMQLLRDMKIPFAIIVTKIDAVSNSQRIKRLLHVQKVRDEYQLDNCFPQIFMLSNKSLEGMAYFMSFIAHITGNLNPETS